MVTLEILEVTLKGERIYTLIFLVGLITMRKEQLAKFQNQINSAVIGYLNLLERKELLSVSINTSSSLSNLDSPIQRCILSIQDTIYASLIVDVHSWLFDKSDKSSNLSPYNLLESLVDPDVKFNTKRLQEYFITTPSSLNLSESGSNWQEDFVSERKAKFDQVFHECTRNIKRLLHSEEAARIKPLRDKFLAHKDGVYDVKANGHKIGDVFYLLDQMKNILLSLNTLFQRVSYPIEESEQQAKSNAEEFWNRVART